jgi:signal transduction histidine kinase/CheY-like chemotaxis protein
LVSWHSPAAKVTQFVAAGRNLRMKKGTGVAGRIWEAEEPLWLSERDLATNFPRAAQATQEDLHSAFGVPISFQREILGVLNFFGQKTQRPDQSQIKTLNIISSQFGQFIERKRGEEQRTRLLAQEQEARHHAEATSAQLQALQRVTDAALAHLSLNDLLPELLGRIRVALKVDTVAILLLEKEGDELVAWAALGLEEEVERGVRIPVGKGFAGRIIAQGKSITIEDVSKADVHNPLLREKGIVSLLGVPLWVAGRALGVLHVGTLQAHRFTAEDQSLLQLVADRIAVAIENSRLYEVEQSARVEAERLNRLKDDFLTILSHELRTPLTPIIGWLNMMETGILVENDYERAVAVMRKNADSLKHLINDLLDMSAILSGKMRVEENVVSLAEVLREATESMRVYAGESDIELRLTAGNDELLVKGDKTRLVQVFSNLLQNAIKFSVAGGVVGVSIRADPKEVVVTVADTGQGMSADFVPYVFERFRQEDGSRTRAHGGLGLGLALVKSFVEAHGGDVVASSEGIGKGSKFSVTLPLLSNEDTTTFRESVLARGDGNESMRAQILIVEDQADTREMLVNLFRSHGFGAHSCESALDALETVKEKRFDLIVSDIAMPTMDGLELMRELRQLGSAQATPAIALSGYASERDVQAALAAGFNMHVAKPVGPEELIRLARKLMEKSPPIDLDSGSLIG